MLGSVESKLDMRTAPQEESGREEYCSRRDWKRIVELSWVQCAHPL